MVEIVVGLDKPADAGACVGRTDGRVVFCGYGLPGETVTANVVQGGEDARYWRAEAVGVVGEPAVSRVPSPCPWFGPGLCGGCAWLHAEPDAQLALKAQVLTETLQRLGGVSGPVAVKSLGSSTGWRTRVTLHVDANGDAGFHAPRSHEVILIADCLQADPRMELGELLAESWPPGATVQVSVSDAGRAVRVASDAGVSTRGPNEHVHTVRGRQFRCAAHGFWQSHRDAGDLLVGEVRRLLPDRPTGRIVDLYAGVGLFGLSLLDSHDPASVVLVEGNRAAAGFARRNAEGDPRVEVDSRDVRKWARRAGAADVIVLDPPRAGVGRKVVEGVVGTGARTVVYVSCEPSTLARDLKYFAGHGYTPDHLEGFDVFPGTAHIETVVRLRPS